MTNVFVSKTILLTGLSAMGSGFLSFFLFLTHDYTSNDNHSIQINPSFLV